MKIQCLPPVDDFVFRARRNSLTQLDHIMILRNSSLNPEAVKISSRFVKGKSTKKSFKNLRYRNTLMMDSEVI